MKTKKEQAIEFINSIRTMEPKKLQQMITDQAGEELAQFFLNYAGNLIEKDPTRVLENCSSLMLMGYLIARVEEGKTDFAGFFPVGTPSARA